MKADDFEACLQGQPVRQIPAEWRSQILSATEAAAGSTKGDRLGQALTCLGTFRGLIVSLLWPSPKVWAGLAAIWMLLGVANRATLTQPLANSGPRPAAATIAAWKEQERILAELIQPGETSITETSGRSKPRPRSDVTGRLRMG